MRPRVLAFAFASYFDRQARPDHVHETYVRGKMTEVMSNYLCMCVLQPSTAERKAVATGRIAACFAGCFA